MKDKIKAVMLGHAIGDALGVPAEFVSREKLDEYPIVDMKGFGTYRYPAGTWSDDTSMSLATFDSLLKGEIDWEEIMNNFVKWLVHDEYTATGVAFDVGVTCINAIDKFYIQKIEPLQCGDTEEYSNGNGSLMRIHPFVLFAEYVQCGKEWLEIIHKASALTHAHSRSQIGCGIYAIILKQLLEKPEEASIHIGLRKAINQYYNHPEFAHYKRISDEKFPELRREEIKSSGYVVDTLEAAVWCLMNTKSYEKCVLTAVNLGGDTDTIAAIAGGLAGALYGYDAIPEKWLNTLIKRDYIEEMCEMTEEQWIKK